MSAITDISFNKFFDLDRIPNISDKKAVYLTNLKKFLMIQK